MVELLIRNWGWMALRGVLAIALGALTLVYPGITLVTLVYLFGAYATVDGVLMVVSATASRKSQPRWGTLVFGGLLGIAAGVLTYVWPGITALALVGIIACWALVIGVIEIAVAVRLRNNITGEWLMILTGVLGVVFGVLLLLSPGRGALVMVLWLGAYALVSGALLVAVALRLRSWGRSHGLLPVAG